MLEGAGSDRSPLLSAVIPAYNEEQALPGVLDSLQRVLDGLQRPYEIIVVDDGSEDGTAKLARSRGVTVVQHGRNRGYGAALKSGIRQARSPWILITDADGTYPMDAIPLLLSETEHTDMVVGARVGGSAAEPRLRRLAKWMLRRLAMYLSEADIPDLNSGLRIFKREHALRLFPILPAGFSFTTTITLALLCNDERVCFLPVQYSKRVGRSKIRPLRDTLNFINVILRTILYFNPLKVFVPASLVTLAGFGISLGYDLFILKDLTEKTLILLLAGVQLLAIGLLADMISRRIGIGAA
jgi:glycosyltransferase involved in cell wall biosynthesis